MPCHITSAYNAHIQAKDAVRDHNYAYGQTCLKLTSVKCVLLLGMHGRPLYGYRIRDGEPVIDPAAWQVVAAVLQAGRGGARAAVRRFLSGLPREAIACRAKRILRHADRYRAGQARADLPPDPELALVDAGAAR